MNEFTIKPATRQGVIPLIDLYSESGCGKTMSGLLLARGLAGPEGKIVLGDTETRRGSLYADVIPGGFNVIDMDPPFSPQRHIDMLQAMFDSGAKVGVLDSASHWWEGIGGVCDMASESEDRTKKQGLHNWRTPKFEHQKLVQFLLRSPIPLICCIRAKYKTRQKKDEHGKTVIVKDEVTSPIQAEDFIFESTAHAEILPNHSIILTKCSHPDLRKCFPADKTEPIGIKHGELIAQWCKGGTTKPATTTTAGPTDRTRQWMIDQLKGREEFAKQYAIDKGWIMPDEGLEQWPLHHVPITKPQMNTLLREINVHVDGDGVA